MPLTDEFIKERHAEWLQEAGPNPDFEKISVINEKLRALYVLQTTAGTMSPQKAMSLYMVRTDVANEILPLYSVEAEEAPRVRRSDRNQAMLDWCAQNVGVEIATKDFAELHGISYPTALKFITDRPDVFWKVGRGTYEVRDPKADRENKV